MKAQPLSPMEDALERERAARDREMAHGTPAVLNALAERIRRPRDHYICADCRRPIGGKQKAFDERRCDCASPRVVETFW